MKTEYLVGGTGVVVTDGMADAVRRVLARLPDQVAHELAQAAEAVATRAEVAVPTKTGRLKASIRARVRVHPDVVTAGVGIGDAGAPYGFFVKFGKKHPLHGRSVWQELLRKPMLNQADEVAKRLGRGIAKGLGG